MRKTTKRTYKVVATITDGQEVKTITKDVVFSTDPEDYGNGTYLWWSADNGYDIRYDTDYTQKYELAYLVDFMNRYWSGDNGSWTLVGVQAQKQI